MTPPDPERLAWYETNDLGNAERLKARSGGLLLYVRTGRDSGYWIAFDGQRWNADEGEKHANRLAHDVARAIGEEVRALSDQITGGRLPKSMVDAAGEDGARKMAHEKLAQLHKWAIKSGNAAQTRGMLAQAADEMSVPTTELDLDPLALNCRNGTLRFVQGQNDRWEISFKPHDPSDRITRLADVDFEPDADCPQWRERMALIQPDEDQREQLQVLMGYTLTGLTSEQQFYLQQGPGGDGKSATWATFARILGDYHRRARVQSFLEGPARSGSDHSSDLARLAGDVRLVTASEPPKRASFNASVIKEVTGGDKVTARPMRETEIEYVPHWKLVIECNGLPRVPVSDDGWWRRCRVISWPFQFLKMGVQPEQPHLLQRRLMSEASGILNWAIEGTLRWLNEGGVPMSRTSKAATEEYRRSSDPFDEWYLDRCVTNDRSNWAWHSDLYDNFKAFCSDQGVEKVMTSKSFALRLAEKQHARHKHGGEIQRIGIRLRTANELRAAERAEESRDCRGGIGEPSSPPIGDVGDRPFGV